MAVQSNMCHNYTEENSGKFNNVSARRALVDWYLSFFVMCKAGGKFNNASALGRSLYWCQALHIMNKDRYQSTSARRALALLNSPLTPVQRALESTRIVELATDVTPRFYPGFIV